MIHVERIQYRDAELNTRNGLTISEFDGAQWHRDLVGSREELIQWMVDSKFHDIDPDEFFPLGGNA